MPATRSAPQPCFLIGKQPRRVPAKAVPDLRPRPTGPDDPFRVSRLRARVDGGDTVLTGVLADQAAVYGVLAEGQWQPTTPRSALGYDSPFTRRGSSSLTPASDYLR
jgi:hypothetical protein